MERISVNYNNKFILKHLISQAEYKAKRTSDNEEVYHLYFTSYLQKLVS